MSRLSRAVWATISLLIVAFFFTLALHSSRTANANSSDLPRTRTLGVSAGAKNLPGPAAAPAVSPQTIPIPVAPQVVAAPSPATNLMEAASDLPAQGRLSERVLKQIAALETAKQNQTAAERKMDTRLVYGARMSAGQPIAEGVPTQRVHLDYDAQGRVLVDIQATVTDQLLRQIEVLGGEVINSYPRYDAIRAGVPLVEIAKLAAGPDVSFVRPAARARLNTVISEGDSAHEADIARATLGANGTGVKVGVLSDSVDYLSTSKVAGLVTVLPGQDGTPATGEGTAMLEIIHDLAPGAQLYFATANDGEAQFATNILRLRFNYGCDVLVDDITYSDESPFQDGVVAQAVDAVTASGGLYFSAAGNSGNLDSGTSGTWEGDFLNGGLAGSPVSAYGGGYVHNFGPADYDTITQSSGSDWDTVLFWSDPLGASANDYDLFILNSSGTAVVDSSLNYQTGTQDPVEDVVAPNAGERVVIVLSSGNGRFLHLDTGGAVLAVGTRGSTRGHNAVTNGFCIAATDVANAVFPSAFAGGSQDPVEYYSSDGPRRMFFYPDGTPMTAGNFSSTGGTVFRKPDLTAADGVTTDLQGFAPFYGTSAAAPHAAAIAALLKSYDPNLSASQVRGLLAGTALDVMAAGVDPDSGAGIVMALPALQSAVPDPLEIAPVSGLMASGSAGGPFEPGTSVFELTNSGTAPLNWALGSVPSWVKVSSEAGSLAPAGPSASVGVSLNAVASNLVAGVYYANLQFTDQTTSVGQRRSFILAVPEAIAPATNPDAVRSLGPVAYWRLNETNPPPPALETTNAGSLGTSGAGTALQDVTSGEPGVVGNSFRFRNPNQVVPYFGSHVDVPWNAALNPNGPFTVEFWAKPAQPTTDLFCPASAVDTTQNGGNSRSGWIFYQAPDNTWQFRVGGFSGYAVTLSGGLAQAGVWQHVVGVYDGGYASLYVNGQLAAGPTFVSGFNPNPSAPLRLGATTIPNRTYDGWVDEVAFYPKALSPAQVAAHYAAATTNNAGYALQILADGPLGFWPLDNPVYVTPEPEVLPVAFNSGSLSNLYGLYEPGCTPGVPGVPFSGFGPNNRACRFNGMTGYIDIPGSRLDIPGPVTLLAWVRANPANGRYESILSGGDPSFRLTMDGDGYPGFSDGLQSIGDLTGANPIDDGQWHQLAGVYDGVNSEFLYVDGQLAASTNGATVPVVGNAGGVWIGAAPDHQSYGTFDGDIDEVAVFDRAITASQIGQLHLATNAPPVVSVARAEGVIQFSWNAVSGQVFQLQYKTNLAQAGWADLGGEITATNVTATATDKAPSDPQRFYRILAQP